MIEKFQIPNTKYQIPNSKFQNFKISKFQNFILYTFRTQIQDDKEKSHKPQKLNNQITF